MKTMTQPRTMVSGWKDRTTVAPLLEMARTTYPIEPDGTLLERWDNGKVYGCENQGMGAISGTV